MSDIKFTNVQQLVLIADKKKKDTFLGVMSEYGARMIETVYAHGSMNSALASAFGFESEQSKVMLICLMKSENAKQLIDVLRSEYSFDEPNTGIAFTIPLEGMLI